MTEHPAGSVTDGLLHDAIALVPINPWDEVWVVQPAACGHDLRVIAANEAAGRAVGRRPEELAGQPASSIYPPPMLADAVAKVRAVLQAGRPLRYRHVHELPDRQSVLNGLLVPIDGGRVIVVLRDRSAEFAAIRQLEELEQLAGIGCWQWNLLDGTLAWSSGYRRVLGIDDDEPATFERLLASIHPDDREMMASRLEHEPHIELSDLGFRIVRPDGEVRFVYGRAQAAVDDRGRRVRLFGTIQDITERRETELRAERVAHAQRRQAHALDLNDHIVQGLSAAQLALQLGDLDLATTTVQRTLLRAQQLVQDLLVLASADEYIAPGSLVRSVPATLLDEDAS